jgi:hypothetical protein
MNLLTRRREFVLNYHYAIDVSADCTDLDLTDLTWAMAVLKIVTTDYCDSMNKDWVRSIIIL